MDVGERHDFVQPRLARPLQQRELRQVRRSRRDRGEPRALAAHHEADRAARRHLPCRVDEKLGHARIGAMPDIEHDHIGRGEAETVAQRTRFVERLNFARIDPGQQRQALGLGDAARLEPRIGIERRERDASEGAFEPERGRVLLEMKPGRNAGNARRRQGRRRRRRRRGEGGDDIGPERRRLLQQGRCAGERERHVADGARKAMRGGCLEERATLHPEPGRHAALRSAWPRGFVVQRPRDNRQRVAAIDQPMDDAARARLHARRLGGEAHHVQKNAQDRRVSASAAPAGSASASPRHWRPASCR